MATRSTQSIAVRLRPEEIRELERIAAATGLTRHALIRMAIADMLARRAGKGER